MRTADGMTERVETGRRATTAAASTAETITETVLSQIHAPSPRLGQLVTSLVSHLHAFIRENEVTWDEWVTGLDFLARAGQWSTPERNELMLLSDTSGCSTLVDALNNRGPSTPSTVEGPFHGVAPVRRMGEVIASSTDWDRGDRMVLRGRVLDPDGRPVEDATLDIWQANQVGLYDVQTDEMERGDLRGLFTTGPDGAYWFRSVKPSSYPVPTDGPGGEWLRATGRQPMRPAHVHLIVRAAGFHPLTTHLFVAGDPYLDIDAAFGVREGLVLPFEITSDPEAIARFEMPGPFFDVAYDVVLAPVGVNPG